MMMIKKWNEYRKLGLVAWNKSEFHGIVESWSFSAKEKFCANTTKDRFLGKIHECAFIHLVPENGQFGARDTHPSNDHITHTIFSFRFLGMKVVRVLWSLWFLVHVEKMYIYFNLATPWPKSIYHIQVEVCVPNNELSTALIFNFF